MLSSCRRLELDFPTKDFTREGLLSGVPWHPTATSYIFEFVLTLNIWVHDRDAVRLSTNLIQVSWLAHSSHNIGSSEASTLSEQMDTWLCTCMCAILSVLPPSRDHGLCHESPPNAETLIFAAQLDSSHPFENIQLTPPSHNSYQFLELVQPTTLSASLPWHRVCVI